MRSPRSDLTMDFFVVAMALIGIAKDFYFLSLSLYNYKSLVQENVCQNLGSCAWPEFSGLVQLVPGSDESWVGQVRRVRCALA